MSGDVRFGTVYDFINRLWKLDTNNISSHIKFPKRKPSNPPVKGEKAAPVERNTATEELKDITWILVKRDDAVWLSLRKKRINTSD